MMIIKNIVHSLNLINKYELKIPLLKVLQLAHPQTGTSLNCTPPRAKIPQLPFHRN